MIISLSHFFHVVIVNYHNFYWLTCYFWEIILFSKYLLSNPFHFSTLCGTYDLFNILVVVRRCWDILKRDISVIFCHKCKQIVIIHREAGHRHKTVNNSHEGNTFYGVVTFDGIVIDVKLLKIVFRFVALKNLYD